MKRSARTSEYERFDNMMQRLIRVSHSEIKAKLDAEKKAKARRKKRKSRTSALGRASREQG